MIRGLCVASISLSLGWGANLAEDSRAALAARVAGGKEVGVILAVIDPKGRDVAAYGKVAKDRPQAPNADTVFEIGSITKVFTSLLLADMIERGEVRPDTPVADLLPKTVRVPSRNGRQITLLDLSMQISGLPRIPSNMTPADAANPFADYTPQKLYDFLAGYTLKRDPGEQYEYSNLGAGLLGYALALKAGMSYEQLVRRRILEPLGMTNTGITLTADQKARLAQGYNMSVNPAKNWDFDALAGCGALRSTASDMLTFEAAAIGLKDTPLKAAFARMLSVRKKLESPACRLPWPGTSSTNSGRTSCGTTGEPTGTGRSPGSIQPRRPV